MWSHYGNGHSGICLELDLAGYEDKIVPVKYLADLAPLECASVGDQLRYKAQQWSYEKEYRLILPRTLGSSTFSLQSRQSLSVLALKVTTSGRSSSCAGL